MTNLTTMPQVMATVADMDIKDATTTITILKKSHIITILFILTAAPVAVRAMNRSPLTSTQSSSMLITQQRKSSKTVKKAPQLQHITIRKLPVRVLT